MLQNLVTMAPRKKKTRYEEEPLISDYKDLFENCRKALFQDWVPGEDADAKKVREDTFRAFYNDFVKVTGRVQREAFIMKHDAGFMPPPTLVYDICLKKNGYAHEAWKPYFEIRKSTLGVGVDAEIEDGEVYRKAGYGLFAAKDFVKGEYIGPYLGTMMERTSSTYLSSYSLNIGDRVVDAKGAMWNHWYFALHFINDPRGRDSHKVNVRVDSELRFFAKRNISVGDELLMDYGRPFWNRMASVL